MHALIISTELTSVHIRVLSNIDRKCELTNVDKMHSVTPELISNVLKEVIIGHNGLTLEFVINDLPL